MELFLQFGWGMMDHCCTLIQQWGGGTVILSPRDLQPGQLKNFARRVRQAGGSVLLDPQFYLPHADHARLVSHAYWPHAYESAGFWSGPDLRLLLEQLIRVNRELGSADLILPGLFAPTIDEDWIVRQAAIIDEASKLDVGSMRLVATVALSAESVGDEDQIDRVLEVAETWAANIVYLVCEHSAGEYLVSDPIWLANVLDLTAGLRLQGRQVILGYANHQLLIAGGAAATAIASGTWMNVRSFPPEKFRAPYEDEQKQRAVWYYCPVALSEYKVQFLDVAVRQGVLAHMVAPETYGSQYADVLFRATRPTSAPFTERHAFRHYLQCLHTQAANARHDSFDETIEAHERTLDEADGLLRTLHLAGVSGQHRDFQEIVEVNRAALRLLNGSRGPLLRRYWQRL